MCIRAFIGDKHRFTTVLLPGFCHVTAINLAGVIAVNEIPYMVHSIATLSSNIPGWRKLLDIEHGTQSWFITVVLVFIMVFIHCLHFVLLHSSFLSQALDREQEHGEAQRR